MTALDNSQPALQRLMADDLIRQEGERYHTTRRFQGAMMRAALQLLARREQEGDLRLPLTLALLEIYGAETPNAELAAMVETILPIEAGHLAPVLGFIQG